MIPQYIGTTIGGSSVPPTRVLGPLKGGQDPKMTNYPYNKGSGKGIAKVQVTEPV